MRHLLEIDDLSSAEVNQILDLATSSDAASACGQGHGPHFEKPSARTRNSMEMAVVQLGGIPSTSRVRKSDSTPVRPSKT